MRPLRLLKSIALVLISAASLLQADTIQWSSDFPNIPDKHGFAGPYAGVTGKGDDRWLIFGGGANFPEGAPWETDAAGNKPAKIWYDSLYAIPLEAGSLKVKGEWTKLEQKLPEKLGYGSSVTLPSRNSVLFIGGSKQGGKTRSSHVYEITRKDNKFEITEVAQLPLGLSGMGTALIGNNVFVFSGSGDKGTVQKAWTMNVSDAENSQWEWQAMPWPESAEGVPARGRMHPTVGVQDKKLFIFGGRTELDESVEMNPVDRNRMHNKDFLREAYVYAPKTNAAHDGSWKRIADLPHGISAAPQNAVAAGKSHLLILGGVNVDFLRQQLKDRPDLNGQGFSHPGFPNTIHSYHTITDTWVTAGEIPVGTEDQRRGNQAGANYAPVTVPVVISGSQFLIPSGEVKPGIRSSQVLAGEVKSNKQGFGVINWIVVTVYLLSMVGIGYWFMKKEAASSTDDYFRGGQRIPWWVAGLSIFATVLSSITFMAIPALSYASGWNKWVGQWPIIIIIPLVVFFYLPFFRKLNLTSAYEYLEARFNLAARLIASASFMIFHVGRIAIVLYLPALALASVSDINIYLAITVIGVLCVLYTVMGGIEAVVWTDAIQALVLIGGALLCFLLVVMNVEGGFSAITSALENQDKFLSVDWSLTSAMDFSSDTKSGWLFFFGFLFAALPNYTSGQDVVQRYVTTPSEKAAARSLWMNIFMTLVGSAIFFALGTALYVFYQANPVKLDPTMPQTDGILPFFIMQNLPVGVSGLIVAGVFAAAQSTISSSLNSLATAFVTDFYGRVIAPTSSDKQRLSVARNIVIGVGIIGIAASVWIANQELKSAYDTFNMFVGFVLGPLAAMFALGIFTKRVSGTACLIGAASGSIGIIIVTYLNKTEVIDVWSLLNGLICFVITFTVAYFASFIFPADPKQVVGLNVHDSK